MFQSTKEFGIDLDWFQLEMDDVNLPARNAKILQKLRANIFKDNTFFLTVSVPGLKAKAEMFLNFLPPSVKGDPGTVIKAEDEATSLTLKGAKDTTSIFVFDNTEAKEVKIKLKPSLLVSEYSIQFLQSVLTK